MARRTRRGSALILALSVLMVVFLAGSAVLSLSLQAMRRGRLDALRVRAMAFAEAGGEKALDYLRRTAPDGTTTGIWRTAGHTEAVDAGGDYTISVADGTGDNAGKLVITSTGRATDGTLTARRSIRVTIKLEREDVSVWNNAIFGGVGQAGRSINGNVQIRGSVHLLGDGEEFTDLDGDQRWDAGEPYLDTNRNGAWDPGEPYTDIDGDGRRDPREPFLDVNGNGTRDPALTVTDLSSEFSGDAKIGNNYAGMPSSLRSLIPALPTTSFEGETVETLNAKLRVKHGRVNISGSATAGDPQAPGGSPMVKETLNGTYVNDGWGGNKGASQVYSDNGTSTKYNLGNMVRFPTLIEPVTKNGVSYASYMDYLRDAGMVLSGSLTIKKGTAYGPISDGRGNSLSVDTAGNIDIRGIVYVNGDIKLERNGGDQSMRYTGRGTLVSTGSISISTHLVPATAFFPQQNVIGMIARRDLNLATGSGDAQLYLSGAFYAQQKITSVKQNELVGTFVSSYFAMQNVPHMYQVPTLPDNLPPGMPGSERIWVKTIRVDGWREVASS
ncbi:MAG: hypothetical protein ACK47B_07000 [Armatimonadota bacterium]